MKLRVVVAEAWRSLTASLSTTLAARIKSPADLAAAARENGVTVKETGFFQRTDVIPDALEPSLIPVLLGVTLASTVLVGWLAWSVGRS